MDENINSGSLQSVVLLVDDQAMIAEGIKRMLQDERDITLHYCQDPMDAMNMAVEVNATVILQDLVMPDVDGMTLVRFYRNHPMIKDTPVIVLSSKEDAKTKSEAFSNGANDYLVKLPDKIELIARIRAHSKSYTAQKERDDAFRKLRSMQDEISRANAELEEKNKILHRMSTYDGLTNIPNRRCFDEALAKEWEQALREKTTLSLIMVDIDFFKPYNDFYGHQGGDDCLQKVARVMDETIKRESDLVARYGGEEFSVIMPNTDADGAMKIANELCNAVQAGKFPHEKSKVSEFVSISLGVATVHNGQGFEAKHLLLVADKALYEAKESGRNHAEHMIFEDVSPDELNEAV
jgi:two-component system, chemotaxis family, response regulator WspR